MPAARDIASPRTQAVNRLAVSTVNDNDHFAELPAAMAAQPGLQDSLRVLLHGLLERTGARRAVLLWHDAGHASQAFEALAAGEDGPLPQSRAMPEPEALLKDAAEEAIDQGMSVGSDAGPEPGDWCNRAQQALSAATGRAVLCIPLPGGDAPMGAVILSWLDARHRDQAPGTAALEGCLRRVAPLLATQRRAERPWHWHARDAWQRQRRLWRQDTPRMQRRLWTAGGLTVLALAVLPLPDRVGGQARIEGAQQRVLVAPTDGFIKATHVHPGDAVKADQVLADLAEQDLKLERDRWASQVAQQDNSYAAAMTRADRAEAALSLSRLEEAQAQLALIDEQLKRSQLKAPFDGVVIQGDLSQSIGAPVKQGDTLMTVAATGRHRVVIDIDEADIARLRPGQDGRIALSALPWDTLPLRVVRITPLGVAREGRNVFEVEAEFTLPVDADVRPGLTGQAKVTVGWRPLLWSWTRPVVNRLRFLWWAW